jgi:hypothetical protein
MDAITLITVHCTDCGTECYGQDFVDESFAESTDEDFDTNDNLENDSSDTESPENAENEKMETRQENVDWSSLDDSNENSIAEENNVSYDAKKDK